VFSWLALVFSVGFSMLALLTRRWAGGVDRAGRVNGGVLHGPAGGVVATDCARTPPGAGASG